MFRYRVFAVYRDNLPLIATCVQQQLMLEPQPKQGHPNQAQHYYYYSVCISQSMYYFWAKESLCLRYSRILVFANKTLESKVRFHTSISPH